MPPNPLEAAVQGHPAVAADPIALRLVPTLCGQTGVSSAGYPYLSTAAYEAFRNRVPHVLGSALRVQASLETTLAAIHEVATEAQLEHVARAERVVRAMLNTAAITAPPDLWLLRHVLGALKDLGLLDRLLAGEALDPESTSVVDGAVDARELTTDLRFLQTRGFVVPDGDTFRIAPSERARDVLARISPNPDFVQPGVSGAWRRLFEGTALDPHERAVLSHLGRLDDVRVDLAQSEWTATLEEIELGARMLPVVLGLYRAGRTRALAAGESIQPGDLSTIHPDLVAGGLDLLRAAGVLDLADGGHYVPTPIGRRVFGRGPGPFGIIETYHPYMARLRTILLEGRDAVWVNRTANIEASQDANRRTFEQCNDALDRFCADTGFTYGVFVEHALGRGEATRQRRERSGDESVRYFGADLEDAAIDAAEGEREAGHLPSGMVLVRGADIGEPASLIAQMRAAGAETTDAVMMVGNGFHEVRNQTASKMVRVFRDYHDAGIVLIFTEANALSVEDLLATAWNTYHAGFMYVHAKSGQGLRPSRTPGGLHGDELPASWPACAGLAGYVRLPAYCTRSRTAYPTTPEGVGNPAISVNHLFVPHALAARLGLARLD